MLLTVFSIPHNCTVGVIQNSYADNWTNTVQQFSKKCHENYSDSMNDVTNPTSLYR